MLGLLIASVASLLHSLRAGGPPAEDAAMLLRYSNHLAQGAGITWNVGEHPVEGATDFLYMASIAAIAKILHWDALYACRFLLALCSMLLPLAIYSCARWTLRSSSWLAFSLGLYIASVPSGGYLASGFGAPFMMLVVALATWAGLAIVKSPGNISWLSAIRFSLLALAIGLTRPEGNLLAILLLCSIVLLRGLQQSRRLVTAFCLVFVGLGGAYFLWRIHYFGWPLPNAFYVKGGGHLHLQGLGNAVENIAKLLWPAVPLAVLALRNRKRANVLVALMVPLGGYALVWVLLSNENNHLFRFQTPVLPLVLLYLPLLLEDVFAEMSFSPNLLPRGGRMALGVAGAAYVMGACACLYKAVQSPLPDSSGETFARHLAQYSDRGYTMAVTEAGTFPYFSGWKSIDLLGLNDVTIAHAGVSEEYLDRYKPELLLYHMYAPFATSGAFHRDDLIIAHRDTHAMAVTQAYALHQHYVLAAIYGGEPCSVHVFYVRPNTPDTEAIVAYLRNTPYYFLDTGVLSVDYRSGLRSECKFPRLE